MMVLLSGKQMNETKSSSNEGKSSVGESPARCSSSTLIIFKACVSITIAHLGTQTPTSLQVVERTSAKQYFFPNSFFFPLLFSISLSFSSFPFFASRHTFPKMLQDIIYYLLFCGAFRWIPSNFKQAAAQVCNIQFTCLGNK